MTGNAFIDAQDLRTSELTDRRQEAIEAASDEVSEPRNSAETSTVKFRLDPTARKADALTVMAESFLANGAAALKGGDRHQIVIHVDAKT